MSSSGFLYTLTFQFCTDLCFMFILSIYHLGRYYLYTLLCACLFRKDFIVHYVSWEVN